MSQEPDFRMNTNLHHAFQRELVRIRDGIAAIDLDDPAAREGIQRRFAFFSATLQHHHGGEDVYLWPALREKGEAEELAVIDAMESEHASLERALNLVDRDFADLGPASDRTQFQRDLDDVLAVLKGHCVHEERDAVPIVRKYLTRDDLKEFIAFTRSGKDSMMVLPWVCDGATAAERDSTWGMLPPFVRMFVRPIANRKYAKFTESCGI